MAAILIFTSWKEPGQSAKTREEWGPKLDDMNLVWARVTDFFFCLFVCLSGMRYQAKLLTLSPQIDSKNSYLSILVNDEFYYCTMQLML